MLWPCSLFVCLSVPRECVRAGTSPIWFASVFLVPGAVPGQCGHSVPLEWMMAEGCGNGEDVRWPGAPWSASCLCWVRGHWAGSQPWPPGNSSLPRQHFMVFCSAQVIMIVLPALKSLSFCESPFFVVEVERPYCKFHNLFFFFFFNGILAFYYYR